MTTCLLSTMAFLPQSHAQIEQLVCNVECSILCAHILCKMKELVSNFLCGSAGKPILKKVGEGGIE